MSPRKHIGLKTKLAAALRELFQIDYEHAKLMSAEQIIGLCHFDHGILHGIEVNDAHWNLTPRLIREHREKSKIDTAIVAKAKRIDDKWNEFQRALSEGRKPPKRVSRWPKKKIAGRPR